MSSNDKTQPAKEGPNYPKIVGLAAVAAWVDSRIEGLSNWYRNMDRMWETTGYLSGARIRV